MGLACLAALDGREVLEAEPCLPEPFPVALQFIDRFLDQELPPLSCFDVIPVLHEIVLDGALSKLILYQGVEGQRTEPCAAPFRRCFFKLVDCSDGPVPSPCEQAGTALTATDAGDCLTSPQDDRARTFGCSRTSALLHQAASAR